MDRVQQKCDTMKYIMKHIIWRRRTSHGLVMWKNCDLNVIWRLNLRWDYWILSLHTIFTKQINTMPSIVSFVEWAANSVDTCIDLLNARLKSFVVLLVSVTSVSFLPWWEKETMHLPVFLIYHQPRNRRLSPSKKYILQTCAWHWPTTAWAGEWKWVQSLAPFPQACAVYVSPLPCPMNNHQQIWSVGVK